MNVEEIMWIGNRLRRKWFWHVRCAEMFSIYNALGVDSVQVCTVLQCVTSAASVVDLKGGHFCHVLKYILTPEKFKLRS